MELVSQQLCLEIKLTTLQFCNKIGCYVFGNVYQPSYFLRNKYI
jgi:hypothetical protein